LFDDITHASGGLLAAQRWAIRARDGNHWYFVQDRKSGENREPVQQQERRTGKGGPYTVGLGRYARGERATALGPAKRFLLASGLMMEQCQQARHRRVPRRQRGEPDVRAFRLGGPSALMVDDRDP
jgi:hypothetical protein